MLFPHGGPHSVTCSSFNNYAAFFAQLGYATFLVNCEFGRPEDYIKKLETNAPRVNDDGHVHNRVIQR